MSVPFDADRARALIDVLEPARLTRVCDVGANPLDETPYKGLLAMGGCDVWGFEPQGDAFRALVAAKGPHENYICAAVGDGKTAELKVCADSGFTSLLEPNRAFMAATGQFRDRLAVVARVKLKTTKLDSLPDLPAFDLLKIDIQGGELAAFRGGKAHLATAVAVITEVSALPIYEGQPLLHHQIAELSKHGYFLHKFLFLKSFGFRNPFTTRLRRRTYRSQLGDGDAVLVRGLVDLSTLETEALKHLAILADAVLLTQDLAVRAMMELQGRGLLSAAQVHGYMDLLPHVEPRHLEAI